MAVLKLKIVFLCSVVITLSACGFHLRGGSQIPTRLNPLYLEQGQLEPSQITMIRSALKKASAQLTDNPESANRLFITILPLKRRKIVASTVSGVELVRLTLSMEYRINSVAGNLLVENREIIHNTELELDTSNVLSHEGLIANSAQDLRRSLVRTLVYQLNQF